MLPDEQASPEQIAGLRDQHPDWTEEQVNEQVRLIFFHARG
jgi:hypothetical protein